MSQATLLALLPSNIDPQFVVLVGTQQLVNITGVAQNVITANVNNGVWQRIERANPRSWLVNSRNQWTITSFDPMSGVVCIDYQTPTGEISHFSITVTVYRQGN
jgi:hypothetical protein